MDIDDDNKTWVLSDLKVTSLVRLAKLSNTETINKKLKYCFLIGVIVTYVHIVGTF